MATSLPTFQNQTAGPLASPRYNLSNILVPANKYVTGVYYLGQNTINGVPTGELIYEALGFTDVSTGSDPSVGDIIYNYVLPPTVIGLSGVSGYSGIDGISGYSGYSGYSGVSFVVSGTYADNAAAVTAGLVSSNIYRTPTGQLMIVYSEED